jgi:RND superfamily putative drug exporter
MLASVTGWSIRRPVIVVALWVVAIAAAATVGVGVFGRLTGTVGLVPGSDSDRAEAMMEQAGPDRMILTAIAYGRPVGDPAVRDAVAGAVTDVRAMPGVIEVTEPRPSTATGEALLFNIALTPGESADPAAHAVADRLHAIDAVTVTVAGGPLTISEYQSQAQADLQRAELLTTPIVLLLLLLIFGGLIAAGLPLVVAVAGVAGTFGILYAYSAADDVSVYAIQVATMLSVGVAVDYGLLIVSRFREERAVGPDVKAAIRRTSATAGRTVAYSGLTVAAVLAGLLVFPEPFLRSMGLAGIGVVLVVMAAALTLLPALLALFGHRIKPAGPAVAGGGVFARIARTVQRRPGLALLAAGAVMAVLTVPVLGLKLAQVDARLLPTATHTRQLHDAIARHFPELDRPAPIIVVVSAATDTEQVAELRTRITAIEHVTGVQVARSGPLTVLSAAVDQPANSEAAHSAVLAIRAIRTPLQVAVTGPAAQLLDYQDMIVDHLPQAVLLIAVGTMVLLFLFTGSVLLPIKAVLTNLLSIGAALGVVVWVFQDGHLATWFGTTRLDAIHLSVPVLVATIAFGLSVDYEVFLLSRIRERWLATGDNERAVAEGLQHTGRIITSAALLLGVVFAGFLVAGFIPVKAIGLGLLLAVALDATVVRLVLVPATMTVAGRYNWWAPAPLRRLHERHGLAEGQDGLLGHSISSQHP